MQYALATIRINDGLTTALVVDGKYYALASVVTSLVDQVGGGVRSLLADWPHVDSEIAAAIDRGISAAPLPTPLREDILSPIQLPSKVICTGANYYDHLREMNHPDFDRAKVDILYFLKPSSAVVGSGRSVRFPSQSNQLDWEIELVAVIGRGGRRIPVEHALDHVAGYAIGLDLSARDRQFSVRHAKQFDLFGGKAFDDSSPLGPWFVPARFVDPQALFLRLAVNAAIKQDSNTSDMIWSVAEQVAEVSQHLTLEPGDLIYTGSPAGVGMVSGTYLSVGDALDAEITGLGHLHVEIIPDPDVDRLVPFA